MATAAAAEDLGIESICATGPEVTAMRDVEKDWIEFWEPIVAPNGTLDLDQIKKELSDFSMVMDEVGKVYMHISGGKISKITTHAHHLIAASDEMCTEACNEEIADQAERRAARLEARMPEIDEALRDYGFQQSLVYLQSKLIPHGPVSDEDRSTMGEFMASAEAAKQQVLVLIREVAG